jgi:hypothetical protein
MNKVSSRMRINLSAIAYQEDGVWIAHCLELDIVAEGKSADDAIRSLVSLCDLQINTALEEGDLESVFRAAPPEYWRMFASGKEREAVEKLGNGRRRAPISRFEAREIAFS